MVKLLVPAIVALLLVVMLCEPAFSQERDEPASALEGEWEVVEMIYKGRIQDFGGQAERIKFSKGEYWHLFGPDDDGKYRFGPVSLRDCTIRAGEIDLTDRFFGGVTKVKYELKDGRLWISWHERKAERPTGFGAVADTELTLRILKRVEKAK